MDTTTVVATIASCLVLTVVTAVACWDLRRRRSNRLASAWCAGCDTQRPVCAMNWDSIGQYRCRSCNPDPGQPHEAQSPIQHARSLRYARANGARYRCTECGVKLRKHVWHPSWDNPLPHGVELCDQCIGDDHDDIRQWLGMDIVRA